MTTTTDATRERKLWWQTLAIIVIATLVRLAVAAKVPLVEDEAYYWDWSRHLAFGYFDHPPVIAWLIAGGVKLQGITTMGVRLFPVLCGTVAALALADTARQLAGASAARFAALLLACTPFTVGFILATPDAPLLAFVALTLWAVVRAVSVEAPRAALVWWSVAGVSIGFAMASKFTGILVPIAIALAVMIHPQLRRQLRTPGPWVAVALASLVMLPVLFWNADNQWIAFRFQLGHGLGAVARGSWWQRELNLIGGQAALVTPILFVLLIAAVKRDYNPNGDARRFLLAQVALLALGFFLYSATRRSVEANWPAIGWLPVLALFAATRVNARTRWDRSGLALAGGLTAIALVHAVHPFLPLVPRRDPVARTADWGTLVHFLDQHAMRSTEFNTEPMFAAATRYQDAAMLAWHHPAHPTVMSVNLLGRRNQYDLWKRFQDAASKGATLIIMTTDTAQMPALIDSLMPHFVMINPGFLAARTYRGDTIAVRRTWALAQWRGTWPVDLNDPLDRP